MTTLFYLILTFWGIPAGANYPAMTSQTVPVPYESRETCDAAGNMAKANFNGGAKVEWTCVPSIPAESK